MDLYIFGYGQSKYDVVLYFKGQGHGVIWRWTQKNHNFFKFIAVEVLAKWKLPSNNMIFRNRLPKWSSEINYNIIISHTSQPP